MDANTRRAATTLLRFLYFFKIYLFIYLTSPQGQGHHNSVSQLLWARILPNSPVNFRVGGNRSTRRKPTTFGRALTILFSHEDWVRVHIKMNLTGDRTQNLRGERQVAGLTTRRPKPVCSKTGRYRLNIFKQLT